MTCSKRTSSGRTVSVRFLLSGFDITILIILLCCVVAGPDVQGGIGVISAGRNCAKNILDPLVVGSEVLITSVENRYYYGYLERLITS